VLRLYVGMVYGPQIYLTYMCWVALRFERVIGQIIWAGFAAHSCCRTDNAGWVTNMRVIRRMCKTCLLTTALLYVILKLNPTGAAPAEERPGNKSLAEWGNPKRPATLWSVASRLGPSYRGLR
jgi:hypothetical protein